MAFVIFLAVIVGYVALKWFISDSIGGAYAKSRAEAREKRGNALKAVDVGIKESSAQNNLVKNDT